MPMPPASLATLKAQARALRQRCAEAGQPISHSQSLERLAHERGHRDWNTLRASLAKRPPTPRFVLGMRLTGFFRNQPFRGELRAARCLGSGQRFGLTIRFDTPIDVVTFASMSSLRRQVSVVVDRQGVTAAKTSDGVPHLRLIL